MQILEEIIAYKRKQVEEQKGLFPTKLLEKSIFFETPTVSLTKYLLREDRWGIIAEIKRKSPSQGIINDNVSIERISIGYMQAGASALSILTDHKYFGGNNQDLTDARTFNFCPILRKDFTVDEYQIIEAKSIGADAILLIAAALSPNEVKKLAAFAHSLDLEVLLEVHNAEELSSHYTPEVQLVGVNNRNLQTFEVSVETSRALAESLPPETVKISESGIFDVDVIKELKSLGYHGFLIGQNFMMHDRPELKCRNFIAQLR